MRAYPDNLFDSIVTDPPYELTATRKRFAKVGAAPAKGPAFQRHNVGFMGKEWDGTGIAYDVEMWSEALRVLKPGGHLAAFGGTRTYHRMACAIEDAGFEVRDTLMWIYGTGFPKSKDIAKTMDRRRNDDVRPVCRFLRLAMDAGGVSSRSIADEFMVHPRMVDHWAARDTDSQPTVPTVAQWERLKVILSLGPEMDEEVERLNVRKGKPGEAWGGREVVGERDMPDTSVLRAGFTGPAFNDPEHLGAMRTVAITAPSSAAARQWEGWGTALKPAVEPIVLARKPISESSVAANVLRWGTGAINVEASRNDLGRWPSNLLFDEREAANLGPQARYFYCAKASTAERMRGLDSHNPHPTVKPLALMTWLVRLVTPPGGLVLDPFAGSGSTVIAATDAGYSATGIERDSEYGVVAAMRLMAA